MLPDVEPASNIHIIIICRRLHLPYICYMTYYIMTYYDILYMLYDMPHLQVALSTSTSRQDADTASCTHPATLLQDDLIPLCANQ